MGTNTETVEYQIESKKLKSEDFNCFDAPDPLHKYKDIKWNPLIVDGQKLEETVTKNLEVALEKRLKKIFLMQLEDYLKISDDVLEKWVDKILEVAGTKFFHFVMEENMAFWTEVQERVEEEGGGIEEEEDEMEEGEIRE